MSDLSPRPCNRKQINLAGLEVVIMDVTSCGWTGYIQVPEGQPWKSMSKPEADRVARHLGFKVCGHEKQWWSCDGPICYECRR